MRVLVIRPGPAAARTAARLAGLGHDPVLLCLSRAVPDPDAVETALRAPFSAIAVTSAEAAGLLTGRGREDIPVYAVGDASAAAVRAAGFSRVLSAGGDGRALADMIAREKPDLCAGPLLYLAGNPRAPGFENRLAQAGIPVSTVECYRMEALIPPEAEIERALLASPPQAVLLHSRESARRLFALAPFIEVAHRFDTTRMICMSRNVAEAVPGRYAALTAIAARPDEESLLALLGVA